MKPVAGGSNSASQSPVERTSEPQRKRTQLSLVTQSESSQWGSAGSGWNEHQANRAADFEDCSYGFRPGRSAYQALEEIRQPLLDGKTSVYDADVKEEGLDFLGYSFCYANSRLYPGTQAPENAPVKESRAAAEGCVARLDRTAQPNRACDRIDWKHQPAIARLGQTTLAAVKTLSMKSTAMSRPG